MIRFSEADFHGHLVARMRQRGITAEEIEKAMNEGWKAEDAKPGTQGKVLVFPYNSLWEGAFFEENEVSVYYKTVANKLILLTVKGRYGKEFPRKAGNR